MVKEISFGVDSIRSDESLATKSKLRRLHQTKSIELVLGEQSSGELHKESNNAWRRGEERDEGIEEGGSLRVRGGESGALKRKHNPEVGRRDDGEIVRGDEEMGLNMAIGVGKGERWRSSQNDVVQSIKMPQNDVVLATSFGSSICTKRCRYVFCHVGLYLPRWKTTRFRTQFRLSDGRKSIKIKVGIFK